MTGDYLDVHEHSRAYAIRKAEERAEADAASCVVRHARIEQTHRQFWAAVEAQRQPRPRVRAFRR